MIDLRYLKKLVDMLDASSVDSIEISTDKGIRIRIAKTPPNRAGPAAPAAVPAGAAAPAPAAAQPAAAAGPAPAATELDTSETPPRSGVSADRERWIEVKSPMVGTFYGAPEPGGKPYVAVGDRIRGGQVLCIIEAMKIMNELESEVDGIVREIAVQDAHPVEYGQVLFRVDPHG